MKFSRLRITGFKSFVEPADFVIEPGLTGIVGPNGCGKSNVVDALQWVMGESSYKAMRASGMEEVIFAGSGARPARNAAEVSLTIDNADHKAPVAFNDGEIIEITRRIEREGGSTYRVNGREVRARDVQLLFADAASGAHSPALVGQGRVGALISAKPQARRAVLEGAAGIAGLHGRRHDAELRLKAAEQNLERVEDVLAEIDRQLEALKRQARQAARYKNLSGEIRKAETSALALRHRIAVAARTEAEATLEAAARAALDCAEAQAKAARDQAVAAAAMPALRDAAAAAGAALQRLRLEETRIDSEERRAKDEIAEQERRIAQLADDIQRERRLIGDNAAAMERLAAEDAALRGAADDAAARGEAERRVREAEATLAAHEKQAAEAAAALAEHQARRGQLARSLAEATDRERRLAQELAGVSRERAGLGGADATARLEAALAAVGTAAARLADAETATKAGETAAAAARETEAQARARSVTADAALARVETEMQTLRALLAPTNADRALIDRVRVEPGYEAAFAAAFGDELGQSDDQAAAAHWRLVAGLDDAALPDGVEALAPQVDAPQVLQRRLRQTGIVARSDGPRVQAQLRPGQIVVSREGDVWRWDGFVASAEARRPEAERLAGRNRLLSLATSVDGLRTAAGDARAALTQARQAVEQTAHAERSARDVWREAQRTLDRARTAQSEIEREAGRSASRIAALTEAETRLTTSRNEAAAARQAAEAAIAGLGEASRLEGPLGEIRGKVAAGRSVVAETRAVLAGLDREATHRRDRLAAIAAELAGWRQRQANAETHAAALATRRTEADAARAALVGRPEALGAERRALAAAISSAEAERKMAGDRLATAETLLNAAEEAARAALAALSGSREQRGRAEERLTAAQERTAEVAARIAEVLRLRPDEADAAAGFGAGPLPALDQIEARVERLKEERDRLGGVNLSADQETEELTARRSGIVADRDDLVAAIQKLRQAIQSLNREGRERLLAAFTSVNERFQRLFSHLFGGGTAELQLTESDDPLEAGLEILARPPGKKPQSITLLSGGEQALTALALIFAVFLTNPSPICVLDEVDAPLDDANVERFCALLEEMTRETDTRFLVITHNPVTMARMNRLYGVTMMERGVSQLVSVDLETAESFREAG